MKTVVKKKLSAYCVIFTTVKCTVRARSPAKSALGTGVPTNKGLIPRHRGFPEPWFCKLSDSQTNQGSQTKGGTGKKT